MGRRNPRAADPRRRRAAVIVAHPDDETLWAGGTVLMLRAYRWTVIALCRAGDPDRSGRFFRAVEHLGASGTMADLDDAPEQAPLPDEDVRETVRAALPGAKFDLVLTHSPFGEYTRHRRHEEIGRAVLDLWEDGTLPARALWMFAYTDAGRQHLPQARADAGRVVTLPEDIWRQKYRLITETYGFGPDSFEARTTPRAEAFWCFDTPAATRAWMSRMETQ